MTDVSFSVAGLKIKGKLFMPASVEVANPAVLFLHGWTSRQDRYYDVASALSGQGYICMTFDMRGHGASAGDIDTLTRADFVTDAMAGYDFLTDVEGVDPSRILVVGSSFGAYLAALLTAHRPCAALALRVPANYPDQGFEEPHMNRAISYYEGEVGLEQQNWKSTMHQHDEVSSLQAIHKFKGPVLIVESEHDELVPREVPQSYAGALPDTNRLTYIVMKGAPHSLSKDLERQKEFQTILSNWTKSL